MNNLLSDDQFWLHVGACGWAKTVAGYMCLYLTDISPALTCSLTRQCKVLVCVCVWPKYKPCGMSDKYSPGAYLFSISIRHCQLEWMECSIEGKDKQGAQLIDFQGTTYQLLKSGCSAQRYSVVLTVGCFAWYSSTLAIDSRNLLQPAILCHTVSQAMTSVIAYDIFHSP